MGRLDEAAAEIKAARAYGSDDARLRFHDGAIAQEWRPDVIVREVMEWSGCIVGELLGIPHASVGGNAYSGVDSPEISYFPGNRFFAAAPYARHRADFGLPPDPGLGDPFKYLHLCFMPRRWDRPRLPAPANTQHVRHVSVERPVHRCRTRSCARNVSPTRAECLCNGSEARR